MSFEQEVDAKKEEIQKRNQKPFLTLKKINDEDQQEAERLGISLNDYKKLKAKMCKDNLARSSSTTIIYEANPAPAENTESHAQDTDEQGFGGHWGYVANGYRPMHTWKKSNKK